MTTTVKVMARAWGALVNVSRASEGAVGHNIASEDFELSAHEDRRFDIEEGETVTFRVTHGKEPEQAPADDTSQLPAPDVPGRAQNDGLLPTHPAIGSGNARPTTQKPLKGEPPADASAQ